MNSKYKVTQISGSEKEAKHSYFDLCPESPDGTKVIFFQYDKGSPGEGHIVICSLDGKDTINVPFTCYANSHSAAEQQWMNNDEVVFQFSENNETHCGVYSIREGTFRKTPGGIRMFSEINGLGLFITAEAGNSKKKQTVCSIDINKNQIRELFTLKDAAAIHPFESKLPSIEDSYFKHTKWSPDGRKLFIVYTNRPDSRVKSIFLANADGSELSYLCEFGHHPMWSWDSSYIYAFRKLPERGYNELIAYPVDGSEPYTMLNRAPGVHSSISPDNRYLVTDVHNWEKDGQGAILLYDLQLKDYEVLVTFPLPDKSHETGTHPHPVWSRDGKRVYFNAIHEDKAGLFAVEL